MSESEERSYSQRKPHRQEQDPIPDGQFDNAPEPEEDECEYGCEDGAIFEPDVNNYLPCPDCTDDSEDDDNPQWVDDYNDYLEEQDTDDTEEKFECVYCDFEAPETYIMEVHHFSEHDDERYNSEWYQEDDDSYSGPRPEDEEWREKVENKMDACAGFSDPQEKLGIKDSGELIEVLLDHIRKQESELESIEKICHEYGLPKHEPDRDDPNHVSLSEFVGGMLAELSDCREELEVPSRLSYHLTEIANYFGRLEAELQDCRENQQEYKDDVAELQEKLDEVREERDELQMDRNYWIEEWRNLKEWIEEARGYVKNSDRSQIAPTANTDLLEMLTPDYDEVSNSE